MTQPAPDFRSGDGHRPWWETRPFVALLIILAMVPLLYPPVPPLVDLLGHMGRYRVEVDLATSPWLSRYYGFHWAAIGNLGVDVMILPLSKLFGLELAVKLTVLAIPPLTVAGFLWVAREVHGRLPPTALFALPFIYSHPFMFGFVNYALSIALAFLAFGLWLRLARLNRLRLRAILFVPISLIVFFAHTFGWGVLGLLCFSAEAVRQHDAGRSWPRAAITAALHASVMALPLLIMIAWRSEMGGGITKGWFVAKFKTSFILLALRDRWKGFDIGSLAVALILLLSMIVEARRPRGTLTFSRNLAFSSLVLLAGYFLLPWMIFGSAYADMRLFPYVVAVALLAIRFRDQVPMHTARVLAVLGLLFFLVRIGGLTASMAIAADDQSAKLRALDMCPELIAAGTKLAGTGTGDEVRAMLFMLESECCHRFGGTTVAAWKRVTLIRWGTEAAHLLRYSRGTKALTAAEAEVVGLSFAIVWDALADSSSSVWEALARLPSASGPRARGVGPRKAGHSNHRRFCPWLAHRRRGCRFAAACDRQKAQPACIPAVGRGAPVAGEGAPRLKKRQGKEVQSGRPSRLESVRDIVDDILSAFRF